MNITGITILITGGGSGIGLGLAKAFLERDNRVVITGRNESRLRQAASQHPGLEYLTVDVADPTDVARFAGVVKERFPTLSVLVNNAGIMKPETVADGDVSTAEATIATNLLGPIRLTAALLPLLQKQESSAMINVTSGLAHVPLVITPTYCATKFALHAYTMSMRSQLQGTSTQVIELVPPYVQTELMGPQQAADENAMPLDEFIAESMSLLEADPDRAEVVVKRCEPLRYAREQGQFDQVFQSLNAQHG